MPAPTKIIIRPVTMKGVLAFVEIIFDDILHIKGFKILDGQKGPWLGMPSVPGKDADGNQKYYDSVYIEEAYKEGTPGREYRDKLQRAVLKKYAELKPTATKTFDDQTKTKPNLVDDDVPF
jgi:DNA-binding cell septation regulator SpoVG